MFLFFIVVMFETSRIMSLRVKLCCVYNLKELVAFTIIVAGLKQFSA